MNEQIKKMLTLQRKNKREILELNEMKRVVLSLKAPDQNIIKLIDAELAKYNGEIK